ncbi:MAG: histidine triad nucleotide-binding protein [Calditrichia bacterium]
MDCLFCKIVNKELNASIIYEDDDVVAFHDINPQAPVHVLIIPKKHISTINDLDEADISLTGKIVYTAKKLAASLGIDEDGYRILFNCNRLGGQHVYHIHLHILGGRQMQWPPG